MILLSLCEPGIGARYRFSDPRILDDPKGAGDLWKSRLYDQTVGRRRLFLVHGFNSDQTGAIESYRIIEQKLKDHGILGPGGSYDDVCGVLWPGSIPVGYWIAEARASTAGAKLAGIVKELQPVCVSIETHSLGARVAMGLLEAAYVPLQDLILTAPAIDYESLEYGTAWSDKVRTQVHQALICFSTQDKVLSQIYRGFGSWWRHPFKGDSALGCVGPSDRTKLPHNIKLCDGSAYIPDHSAWRSADPFYECWSKL